MDGGQPVGELAMRSGGGKGGADGFICGGQCRFFGEGVLPLGEGGGLRVEVLGHERDFNGKSLMIRAAANKRGGLHRPVRVYSVTAT